MTFFHEQDGGAYYNEFDVEKAYWLRELMRVDAIAPGTIDTRSIEDVTPVELAGFVQHHFFAGIGVWSYAARLAGWPDDQPIRTLSCPCQPFSAAGKGGAFDDPRHLWPAACWHIEFGRVCPTFGEQVASSDGLNWLDLVSADLEAAQYSIAAFDLCSAGVGSPNIRSRLYYAAERGGADIMANTGCADGQRGIVHGLGRSDETQGAGQLSPDGIGSIVGDMDNAQQAGLEGHAGHGRDGRGRSEQAGPVAEAGKSGIVANSDDSERRPLHVDGENGSNRKDSGREETHSLTGTHGEVRYLTPGPTNGFWRDADWIHCRPEPQFPNGRWRPVRPGSFPLAAGTPARMVRLRGYGDAINAEVATAFIRSYRQEKGWCE